MRIRADQAFWNPDNGWTFKHGQFLGFTLQQDCR